MFATSYQFHDDMGGQAERRVRATAQQRFCDRSSSLLTVCQQGDSGNTALLVAMCATVGQYTSLAQGNNGFFRSGIIAAWAAWRFDFYTVKSLKS